MKGTLQFLGVVLLVVGGFAVLALWQAGHQMQGLAIGATALWAVLLVALIKNTATSKSNERDHS